MRLFVSTYGDGVSNVDVTSLVAHHKKFGRLATLTAVQPPGRYAHLSLGINLWFLAYRKPQGDGGWINGGFFVLEPDVINHIEEIPPYGSKAPSASCV